jgi:aspartate dehydrogenase
MVSPADRKPPALRVGLLGWGAIGRPVGLAVADGGIDDAVLVGVSTRRPVPDLPAPQLSVPDLAAASDVVVEAAGQRAVIEHGPTIVAAGCDLLISSVGALADPGLRARLSSGPGRHFVTSGAVGGLDLLVAARRLGPFESVTLTTTKAGPSLVQPWMEPSMVEQLQAGKADIACFDGPVDEAAAKFPQSINVAAALACAVGDWDVVRVAVRSAQPGASNRHVIEAVGPAGQHRFELANRPSPDNPKTSGVVPAAVLRSIALLRPSGGTVL